MKANDAGDVFPLWGTCLGFQFLSVCGAGGQNVLSPVDGEDYTIPLNLSDGMSYSHLFHTRLVMQTSGQCMKGHT